jgi:hypothetical protein
MYFLIDTCTKKLINFFLSKWHICGGDNYYNICKTTWMMMEVKNYFLLEQYTYLHLTLQKLLDDMVGLHLNNKKKLPKDWQQCHEQIYHDYYAASLGFGKALFKHRYRMIQNLFLHIMASICEYDASFV